MTDRARHNPCPTRLSDSFSVQLNLGSKFERAELVRREEGIYVFIWKSDSEAVSDFDYLQDNVEIAKECASDFGFDPNKWVDRN